MKQFLKRLSLLISVLALIALVVLVTGVVPIKASSGHWAVTRWLLDFASNRSIATHSIAVNVPSVEDPKDVLLGAVTFDNNCRWCHGAPGYRSPSPARQMTPPPPRLQDSVDDWSDRELFYILKHGIKFAGMPAWAAKERRDDVWPTVAFLRVLPELSQQRYRRWVQPRLEPRSTVERLVADRCASCHAMDGNGRAGSRVPSIAGQRQEYLRQSLLAYRGDRRHSGIMEPVAVRLRDDQIESLSKHFAEQEPDSRLDPDSGAGEFTLAKTIFRSGIAERKIPSCIDCHGQTDATSPGDYPRITGLSANYLRRQLRLFRDQRRGGTQNANLMHPIADKLTDADIEDLAEYLSSVRRWASPDAARSGMTDDATLD